MKSDISDFQKHIYNKHLRAFRINHGNPFKYRLNFDKLKDDVAVALIKLEIFFKKYPHLFKDEFFDAPYKLYTSDKDKFYPLSWYNSYKGQSACVSYLNLLTKRDPDEQFEFVKDSLKFIVKFCLEKQIPLIDYTDYCSVAQNDCFKHLKERYISWYSIFGIPHFYEKLYDMPQDEYELYFGEIDLHDIYKKYENSKLCKPYIDSTMKKIEQMLLKKLNSLNENGKIR